MVNRKAIETVNRACFSKRFCKPLYDSYCFSNIPATIKTLFGFESETPLPQDTYISGSYDHVVFIFLDGFGWRYFKQYQEKIPFLKEAENRGLVSVLTSLFPSTTAAHVTCINTGLLPEQSGIYEWFQYEPSLQRMIAPLLFSYSRHKSQLLESDPAAIFPFETFYQKLRKQGVDSYVWQPSSIISSVYSRTLLKGATVFGYDSLEQAFSGLKEVQGSKTYRIFYFPDIDAIAHREGTGAHEIFEALNTVCAHLENLLTNLPPRTAFFVTADHGLTDISPQNTYYLNKHIPHIEKFLERDQNQKPLTPAGSCRDFFLHVKEEKRRELKEILTEFLSEKAEIYFTSELIEQGLFGSLTPSERFRKRVGDLVILPYESEAVWWFEKGRFQQNFYAAHGGLTQDEMEIPFIFNAP